MTERKNLVERLPVQIDSLQEGFELLTKSPSLKDTAHNLFLFLRGNLQTTDIHIFHKRHEKDLWQQLHGKADDLAAYLDEWCTTFVLRSFGGKIPKLSVIQPLVDKSNIGVVLGKKLDGSAYSTLDKISLKIFMQLFANAHHANLQRKKEKDLNFSLNHRLLQLNSLIDTGIDLTTLEKHDSPAALALERAASFTNASWGRFTKRVQKTIEEKLVFPDGFSTHPVKEQRHTISAKFKHHHQTYKFELFEKESREGTVAFDVTDQLLLDAVARQVHAVLENQYLHKQEMEKQKIEQDIAVAASIQQRILPATLPLIEGYDTFGKNVPTRFVGGDYYDCIALPDGRFAFVVADVAGKGVPAALLVSSFHSSIAAFLETEISLVDLAHKLNDSMYRDSTEERYITALIAILDPSSGNFEVLNAGHNPAYVLRSDNSVEEFMTGGLALGMMDMKFPYQSDQIHLAPGERLLLYTDGVTEAMNEHHEQYDVHKPIKMFLAAKRNENAESLVTKLIEDVKQFTGTAPQSDDITAVCIIRNR
jgi:serine phosphatase RsbU (regulator of sigma subunit)